MYIGDQLDVSMTELDVSSLAEALADERLLQAEQYDEFVNSMLPLCQESVILAKELAYRGWLTPFQIEQILLGQAHSLMLGSYVLLEPLGEGSMGRVFRARNWKIDRIVAIKVIRDEQARQPAVLARFQREIRALGRIRHPNIVWAVDADFRPGIIFYAMEFVEGMDLGRYVRRNGPLAVYEACHYIAQTAEALQHAYEIGLIHRDIKPSNILLTEPDHGIKLLDLGLTRCEVAINDSVFTELTRAGALIGTPDFMSPEQVKDSRSADVRSDLYSLGCTFYYLLTGAAPFEHVEAVVDKLCCQCESEPTPVEQCRPDLPPEVVAIVRKLMAKRRRDRFQVPSELVAALESLLGSDRLRGRDTVIDVPACTLLDAPILFDPLPEAPRTEVLTPSELEICISPTEEEESDNRNRWKHLFPNPAHVGIAVVIATLALLLLWQWGIGPGALGGEKRHSSAPAKPAMLTEERREDAETDRSANVESHQPAHITGPDEPQIVPPDGGSIGAH